MNALAERREGEVVQADETSILAIISRAASDPSTDVEKLSRLMDLYERITDRTAKAAYQAALAQMQPDLPILAERGSIKNNQGKPQSTYALWEDINEAIKPILATHGFGLSFRIRSETASVTVTAVLSHREGHAEETAFTLPIDASGSKNNVQGFGSSVSYGKRYTAGALLNLTSRGEDDDGQKAGAPETISQDQLDDLIALMDEVKADRTKFLNFLRIESLANLPAKRLKEATAALEKKRHTGDA